MKWSEYQTAIFDFVVEEDGNAIIKAVAGSGKTTTIVEAISRIPSSTSTIFLAFNKAIAEELKSRGVNARTFHSLTFGTVLRHMGANTVTNDKTSRLVRKHCTKDDAFKYGSFLNKLVGLGKQCGIGCLISNTEQNWFNIVEHHNLELDREGATITRALELAGKILNASCLSDMVDFDDMLYMPVKDGLRLPQFDFLFVDEAQDTNAIQRALLRKMMRDSTRLVAVGDPSQAIYGFRGADSRSMDLITEEFDCEEFELSVSYRCAQSIATYAQQWDANITPSDTAPKGAVENLGDTWDVSIFTPDDIVVCRTTKPLIALAFSMLRERIPVQIVGREIGAGLVKLVKGFKTNSLTELNVAVDLWAEREVEKATAKQNEGLAASIEDKANCIILLGSTLREDSEDADVDMLICIINDLFSPKRDSTQLMTIHKSKGLEADRVFWLNRSQCPSEWARKDWEKQQEGNLCYVATTRARKNLVIIELAV